MIKKLIILIALCVASNADLNVAIQNMLGETDYNTHKNLINHIIKNRSSYYSNNQINYTQLSQELENNGLIKLNLGSVKDIEVSFSFNSNPKKSIRNINEILRVIGQYNYTVKEEIVVNNQLRLTLKLKTAAAISPLRLSKELQSANSRIIDIKREGIYKWNYYIDSSNSTIYKAEDLVGTSQLSLKKPLKPYIIKISNSTKVIIDSNSGNTWYPNIVFYDDDFNIIEIIEKDSLHKSLKLSVPNNTKYIKIDDFYTLANLKRGINITKE